MNAPSQDRALVMPFESGAQSRFNDLARKYRHDVWQFAMRNRADAKDAVRQTFMKAYWGLHHFRGDSALYSWLYCVAVNSAKTALLLRARRCKACGPVSADGDEQNQNSSQVSKMNSHEELVSTEEICDAVNDATDALVDKLRTTIELREFEGLTYRQVASAMSCPVGTVRSRIFRAREALDAHLRRVLDDSLGRARRDVTLRSCEIRKLGTLA